MQDHLLPGGGPAFTWVPATLVGVDELTGLLIM